MHTSNVIENREPPCPEEIRAQLQRIVTSPEFPTIGRGAAFLTYIVEEALAGRADRLKGYAIALEVFKRDQHFTQEDPVVRIEAGRLRRALERYYLVAGQHDPIRIDMPKGGYVPTFCYTSLTGFSASAAEEDVKQTRHKTLKPWRPSKRSVLATLPAVVLAVGVIGMALTAHWPRDSTTPLEPTLVIAPFAILGDGPKAQLYAAGLAEELLTALPRFKEIRVFGRETSRSLTTEADIRQVREELGARYLLAGGIRADGQRIRISARLIETSDGAILWSQTYDNNLHSRDLFTIQEDVASQVATAIAQPYGIIAEADSLRSPPDDPGAYECTLAFYAYRAELSIQRHASVRNCLEKAVSRYPSYATAWAMLSIVYLDEERYRFNETVGGQAPIERALHAARRAVLLEPGNIRSRQALMTALFFNQEPDEAIRVGDRALADNPNDTEFMGEFGTRLAISGQWQRGADLLDKAMALNPGGGGFYRGTRALAAYMLGDTENAVAFIRQADMQKFPLFHGVAAVIYAEAGLMDDAHREANIFVQARPDFVLNFFKEMRSRNMHPDDLDRLLAGLRKAGVKVLADLKSLSASSTQ